MVDVDDLDEIRDLVMEREGDMLSEEHIPIHVIPARKWNHRSRKYHPSMLKISMRPSSSSALARRRRRRGGSVPRP